ncbi:g447 [Coccomyxa viridis]|uniref:Pantoate--beta-alanine ligase n=1 Tax=Coccomyxa viridis TaxID=1274662 RepID=A0ABP1FFR6_9CHLO
MRQYSRDLRRQGKRIGLVPTMGSLHEGHLSLIEDARKHADCVVVSIYVNPTQFAQHEDFGVYPRQQEQDLKLLRELGVEAAFLPASLYATGRSGVERSDAGNVVGADAKRERGAHQTFIQVEDLQKPLCGQSRPHFFRGVATVVAKLFNIVEPDVAVFGRKDYQQFLILSKMACDLDFPVEVIGMPIVREQDGLAMSSRNKLLSEADRQRALCICQALKWASQAASSHECTSGPQLAEQIAARISQSQGRVDYVEVVDAQTLEPVGDVRKQSTVIAVAAFFGSVRLIDNLELTAHH